MEFSDIWNFKPKTSKKTAAAGDQIVCPGCDGTKVVGTQGYIDSRTLSPEWRDVTCGTCHGAGWVTEGADPKRYEFWHDEAWDSRDPAHPSVPCPPCEAELVRTGATPEQIEKIRAGKNCAVCFKDMEEAHDTSGYGTAPTEPYSVCGDCGETIMWANRGPEIEAYQRGLEAHYEDEMRARAEEGRYF